MNQLLKLSTKFLKKIPMLFNRRHFKKTYRKLPNLEFDQVKLARQLGHHYKTFQRQPKSRKALLLGSLILITLTPMAIFLARHPKEVRSWWNDNWQFRIKTTITEQTGSALTDFQVAISLDTASLITAGKMQSDCDDIRVYDTAHQAQQFWVESCNQANTSIWLKQSFSANEAKYYYVYYGNPNAQNSETDGTDIFIFFDDFSGTNLKPNWTEVTAGGATAGTISNGLWTKTCDGECDWWNTTDLDAGAYVPFPTISEADITWEATTRLHSTTSSGNKHIGMMLHQAVRDGYIWGRVPSANNYRVAITGSDNQCSISSTTTPANLKIRKTTANGVGANNSFTFWLDTGSGWTQCGTYAPSDIMSNVGLMIKDWDSGSTFATYDYFYIKHYATTEPTNSNAAEESAEGPVGYWKFDESTNTSHSTPLGTIEHHISLLNEVFTTYSDTFTPENNALGAFRWDANKYPGASVYLEATIYSNHPNDSGQVALYTSSGDLVANSTILFEAGTGKVRSPALTLSDGTDYTLRIRTESATYGQFYTTVYSANLIIIQNDTNGTITSTQAQIDIGDNINTTSNSYVSLTNPKIYYHDASQFSPTPTSYFEASLKGGDSPTIEQQINISNQIYAGSGTTYVPTDNSLGIINWDASKYSGTVSVYLEVDMYDVYDYWNGAKFALYDSAGNVVTSSITNIPDANTTSHNRYRSTAITDLVSGTNYTVRAADAAGTDGFSLKAARLIVIQTDPTKIQTTQTQIEVGAYQTAITATTYAELTNPKYYQYNASQFSPTIESSGDASFSATLKIDDAGDTAYAELYNRTNSTVVAEVSHTGDTNWTYKTISNIDGDADWDTTNDDEYVVRVRCNDDNGGGCSANIANAKIHLNQFAADGITGLELVHHQINTARTDADTTYTEQNYRNRFNPGLENTQVSFAGANISYYFESTLKTSAGTGYAQLKNYYNVVAISGSEVSTTSTSFERKRSGDITGNMPSNPTTYGGKDLDTELKNSATNTTTASNSWLIVDVNQLSNAGITTAYAELYNLTDSVVVSGSEVSNNTTSWSRIRSSALTLSTNKEYIIRTKSGVQNLPTYLANARIIHDQTGSNGIGATELIWPMINTARTDADATYSDQETLISYDPSSFDLNFSSIYFESTLKTSAGTGYAQLRNDTDNAAITGSEITTTSTGYDLVRSSALQTALPSSTKNLDTQLKNNATNTTTASSSWLVIQANQSYPVVTYDSTGQQNHGSVENATWEQSCLSHSCLKYDGTDDHVWVADSTNNFDFTATQDFTLTGWFKSGKSSSTQVLLAKYESTGSDGGYKVYLNSNGTVSFGIDDDNASFPEDVATSTQTYDDSSWHHFAAVKDDTTSITLYIDGLPVAEDTSIAATGTLANNDKLYFGIDGNGTSNPFSGWLDEFKVYPYARTPDEIKTDYTGSATVLGISTTDKSLTDSLVLHWPLDEAATPAVDSSGNQNNGTWQGDAAVTTGKLSSAIDLDGTTDRVDTANDNNIPQTYSWSVSMSSWSKRKPITLTNNVASELTNYQVQLTIPHDADMQPDFDDLRFTNAAGTALDYWLESKTDSTTATIWVEVDSLPASTNTTIYMYYGNSTATSESSSANTMIMFEDMETQPAGTLKSNATYDATNKYTQLTAASSSVNGQLEYAATPAVGWATYWKQWTGGGSGADALYFYTNASSTPTNEDASINGYIFTADEYSDQLQVRYNGSIWTVAQTGIDNSAWHTVKNVLYQSGATYYFQFWYDGILKISNSSSSAPSGSLLGWGARTGGSTNAHRIDDVYITKFISPEPSPSIGLEQSSSILPISMSAWLNADTLGATDRIVFSRGNDSGGYSWYVKNDSANPGKLKFTSDGGATTGLSATTLSTGSWYHVALTVDATTTKLFINGRLDQTIAHSGTLPGTGNISLGADDDGGNGMDGKLDDFRIYARTLTATDIANLSAWTLGPVAKWTLDEHTGNFAYDTSGHGSTATLTGNPIWTQGKFGSAVQFDGSDDYLAVGDTNQNVNTLTLWVKANSTTQSLLDLDGGTHTLTVSSGTITATGFATPTIYVDGVPSTTLPDTSWHHLTVTTATGIDANSVTLGKVSTAYFAGVLDNITFYNSVLSSANIIKDMNAGHPAPGSPVGSALVHYKFDEGYGDTIYNSGNGGSIINGDLAGSGTTCPATGSCPTWSDSGKFNKALRFDGGSGEDQDDFINAGSNSSIDNLTDMTFSAWIYPESLGESGFGRIFQKYDASSGGRGIHLYSNNSLAYYHTWSTSTGGYAMWATPNDSIKLNQWNHIVVTYNNSNASNDPSMYINGILQNITEINAPSDLSNPDSSGDLIIGNRYVASAYDRTFDGYIDEIQIFSSILTPEQVKQLNAGGFATVMGATSTTSTGTADNSADRAYCIPGDTGTCRPPIGEWLFNENTGTGTGAAKDTSVNSYDGNLDVSMTNNNWVPGKVGSALYFAPSTANEVELGSTAYSLTDGLGAVTLSAWIKPGFISTYATSASIFYNAKVYLRFNPGVDDFSFTVTTDLGGSVRTDTTNLSWDVNEWHHIMGIYDGSNMYIYWDGQKVSEKALTGIITAAGRGYIGYDVNSFNGTIDEVRIFDYALTPAQIAWNYNQGKPAAHWKLDECTGTTANNAISSSYPGTITIGATGDNTSAGVCNSGVTTQAWHNGTTGKRNASLSFDGTDDYVDIGTGPTVVNAVSFWVKPTTTTEYPLDLNGTAYIWLNAGTVTAQGFTTPTIYVNGKQTSTVVAGVWQHITVTTATAINASDLDLGRIEGVGYHQGQLDDIKLFNYVPTSQQVQTEYNQGAVRFGN